MTNDYNKQREKVISLKNKTYLNYFYLGGK